MLRVLLPLSSAAIPAFAQQRADVPAVNTADPAQVIAWYRQYYLAALPVPKWTGDFVRRDPGNVSDDYLRATLQRINYYRAMSQLRGNVVFDPGLNAACQQAALMMAMQRHISHHPPVSWKGYTPSAELAAANSNLCMNWSADLGPGSVDQFMAENDPANAGAGHRRWLLFPAARTMGAGMVPTETGVHPGACAVWARPTPTAFTAANVLSTQNAGEIPPATAWPPAGYVPAPLVYKRWSFSCANADFQNALVRVTKGGRSLSVALEPLEYQTSQHGRGSGLGLNTLVWTLPGHTIRVQADEAYQVRVSNVHVNGRTREFVYPVVSFDPAVSLPRQILRERNDLATKLNRDGIDLR